MMIDLVILSPAFNIFLRTTHIGELEVILMKPSFHRSSVVYYQPRFRWLSRNYRTVIVIAFISLLTYCYVLVIVFTCLYCIKLTFYLWYRRIIQFGVKYVNSICTYNCRFACFESRFCKTHWIWNPCPVIFLNIEYRNLGISMNLILCSFITYQALGAVGALGFETFL